MRPGALAPGEPFVFGTGKGALHCGAHAGGALADVDNYDLYLYRHVYNNISRRGG